jgi:hypothetical protein
MLYRTSIVSINSHISGTLISDDFLVSVWCSYCPETTMLSVKNREEPDGDAFSSSGHTSFSGENRVEGGNIVQGFIGSISIGECKRFELSKSMMFLITD